MADGDTRSDLRSLMRRVFSERGKEPVLVLNRLRPYWHDVVGPELGARTWPQRVDGRTLWIAAPDASWVYELQFFKAELLGSIQTFLESQVVADLRFRVGEVPASAAPRNPDAPAPESVLREAQRLRGMQGAQAAASRTPAAGVPEAPESGAMAPPPPTAPVRPRPAPPAAPAAPPAAPAAPAPEAPPALAEAAKAIADPALRAVFQRSLAKQRLERGRQEARLRAGHKPAQPPDGSDEH